jgi:hypothetical protein
MKEHTEFCMKADDFLFCIENHIELEILTRGYWHSLGKHVYLWDKEVLIEKYNTCNYRRKPNYPKIRLTSGCLSDNIRNLPEGYLW